MARRAFGVRAPVWQDGKNEGLDDALALRVMPGPEFDQFTAVSQDALWREAWRITPQSNRMGSRLHGPVLQRRHSVDMLSSAVIPGTIQVPPSGQPIILMGDAQTTGGYPRIGVVIRADLWKLAQAPLGGRLRLVCVDGTAALAAWAALENYLAHVTQGLGATGWTLPAQNRPEGESHAN